MSAGYDDELFYWRLCHELSVIDAAILIINENPSERIDLYDQENGIRMYDEDGLPKTIQRRDYPHLQPVLKALRSAIFSSKLKAKISYPARGVYNYSPDLRVMGEPIYHTVKLDLGEEEEERVIFDHLIVCQVGGGHVRLGGPLEKQGNWYHRRAHEWRLTSKPMQTPKGKVLATNDWHRWQPQKTERGSETEPSVSPLVPFQNRKRRHGSE